MSNTFQNVIWFILNIFSHKLTYFGTEGINYLICTQRYDSPSSCSNDFSSYWNSNIFITILFRSFAKNAV